MEDLASGSDLGFPRNAQPGGEAACRRRRDRRLRAPRVLVLALGLRLPVRAGSRALRALGGAGERA